MPGRVESRSEVQELLERFPDGLNLTQAAAFLDMNQARLWAWVRKGWLNPARSPGRYQLKGLPGRGTYTFSSTDLARGVFILMETAETGTTVDALQVIRGELAQPRLLQDNAETISQWLDQREKRRKK